MPKVLSTEPGASGYSNQLRKFGRVSMGATEAILWDGANGYEGWLPNEEDIEWSSDSVDDVVGGSGVSYLQFTGQGKDGIEKTYSGIINGASWIKLSVQDPEILFDSIYTGQCVNTENLTLHLNESPLVSDGAANHGTITIRSVTTQKIMALILPNLGRTQMMIWRCPLDHYAEFKKISIYPTSGKPVIVKLMARDNLAVSWVCVGQIDFDGDIASITHPFPDYISPGTDLCLVATAEQVSTNISSQMWINKKPITGYGTA